MSRLSSSHTVRISFTTAILALLAPVAFGQLGENWEEATGAPGWSGRWGHTMVTHAGKLWVLGGVSGSTHFQDVWSSTDGVSWIQELAAAPWSVRRTHTSVVFDGKIWVIGGFNGSSLRDVWSSVDGVNWTQVTTSAGWSARNFHSSVVFDGRIWVIGGIGNAGSAPNNDVWSSTDGATWTYHTGTANPSTAAADANPWEGRHAHTSVVFDNKIWVMGGGQTNDSPGPTPDLNDVWYSSNGTDWTLANANAPWTGFLKTAAVTLDGRMWMLGGLDNAGGIFNDVWYSGNGVHWVLAPEGYTGRWAPRGRHAATVHDGRIWLSGGTTFSGVIGDVWFSEGGSRIFYVSKSNLGFQDGLSWPTAFRDIQPAIDAAFAAGGGEVWVEAGIHDEQRNSVINGEQTGSVVLRPFVGVYGGFLGNQAGGLETNRSQRDFQNNVTVIDGSTSRGGSPAYHVIFGASHSTIDGFHITGGIADGASGEEGTTAGAGIMNIDVTSASILNCNIHNNVVVGNGRGAGINNVRVTDVLIELCVFDDNDALGGAGAGLNNKDGEGVTVRNSIFRDNDAVAGGAVFNERISNGPHFVNCIFAVNSASNVGGAMHNQTSNPSITNSTFFENTASDGGGINAHFNSAVTVLNSILWNDSPDELNIDGVGSFNVTHSDVQGHFPGTGNINQDPQFLNPAVHDLRLLSTSPCIDAGTDVGAPAIDIGGNLRPAGAGIDMGAYEGGVSPPVAEAGGNQTVECTSPSGATVTLDGSGSTDADSTPGTNDDIVLFEWLENGVVIATGEISNVQLSLGIHDITLRVTDSLGETGEDFVFITVQDTTPPAVAAWLERDGAGDDNDDDDEGRFVVRFTVADVCDDHPDVNATLIIGGTHSLPAIDGQLIEFEIDDEGTEIESEGGVLEVESMSLLLEVTATDASGNHATAQAVPSGLSADNDAETEDDD